MLRTPRFRAAMLLGAPLIHAATVLAQPNIVFIMADDFGWADTSNPLTTMGDPTDFYETPTLETLAAQGMAFTNAYANQTCAPTRSAILSGAYAPRPTNNVFQVGSLNPTTNSLLVGIDQGTNGSNDKIPASTITHAETLQTAGYETGYVGKFHVTTNTNAIVNAHGFDVNYGGGTSGGPGDYHASGGTFGGSVGAGLDAFAADYTQQYVDNFIKPYATDLATQEAAIDALVGTPKHLTDASADAAIAFMEANNAGPFFLQYSPHAVHTPIDAGQARSDLLAKYQAKPAGVEDSNAPYAALIEGMDQSVARLIDYLQTTPDPASPGQTLDQNTLVIFYSDNGGAQDQANNGPLTGSKSDLNEGGLRVPMIAWSANPALVDGGTVSDQVVVPVDFYKTFASLAGATLPTTQELDGVDLSGAFADVDGQVNRGAVFWHFPGNLRGGRNEGPQSVIRKRIGETDWKLTYSYEDQSWELYNLDADISESDNRAAADVDVLTLLGAELLAWLDEVDAPLATVRSGSIQVSVTGTAHAYANGVVSVYSNEVLSFNAGEELPLFLSLLPADLSGDGDVDDEDLGLFFSAFTGPDSGPSGNPSADLSGDGDVDDEDLGLAFSQFTGPLAPVSVPEPGSWALLSLGGLLALCRGRSR